MKLLFLNSPVFMGILTIVLITLFAWFVYHCILFIKDPTKKDPILKDKLKHVTSIGLFALVVGVLHQLISWYFILYEIEKAGDITPGMVISALKTTMVPLTYGVAIYLFALLLRAISYLMLEIKSKA
jgi:hypothetical protein